MKRINCRDFLQMYHPVGLEREPTQSGQYFELLEIIMVHKFLSEFINSRRSINVCDLHDRVEISILMIHRALFRLVLYFLL
jgi:hypothetical protein